MAAKDEHSSSTDVLRISSYVTAATRAAQARISRAAFPWLLALSLLVTLAPHTPAEPAEAAGSVALPFAGGKPVKIIQGYNGGTHQGRSHLGLDLMLAEGETGGADVVAPFDGNVTWAQGPKSGNGCIAIAMASGSHSVMMCHVILSRAFARDEAVKFGQKIGTVGVAGTVGNNGVAHIHYELHAGKGASSPVPFAEPNGLALEGQSLPTSSTTAVVSRRAPIVSSNRPGSGPAPTVAQGSPERTQKMSDSSELPTLAAASVPGTVKSVQTTSAQKAVVQGTDSCLKVRKQPAADAPVVGCLKDGSEVALKPLASGADPKWRQTDQGWVSGEYLKRSQAVVAGTGDCLNVRESSKASAKKVDCLKDGTEVTILEGPITADGFAWYRISAGEKSGWAVGKYLN